MLGLNIILRHNGPDRKLESNYVAKPLEFMTIIWQHATLN